MIKLIQVTRQRSLELQSAKPHYLQKDGDFTEEEFRKMAYGNSLELFPALKEFYNK